MEIVYHFKFMTRCRGKLYYCEMDFDDWTSEDEAIEFLTDGKKDLQDCDIYELAKIKGKVREITEPIHDLCLITAQYFQKREEQK